MQCQSLKVDQLVLQFQENMRLFVDLEMGPEEFHIYIYSKSYFYKNLAAGRLQFLSVKRGEYMKVHLSLQVKVFHSPFQCSNPVFTNESIFFQQLESLPILDLYKYTLPEGTQNCENDPAYDRDQVDNFLL